MKRTLAKVLGLTVCSALLLAGAAAAEDREIAGVAFPGEKVVAGKTLKLNGVAVRKAMIFIKVFAGGFYLENPTSDAAEAIESEQVKHFHLHYLTDKATAQKLQDGFIKAMEKTNPPELVEKHRDKIERYASWLDEDMAPGATSKATYVPGTGLTLEYKGAVKGTIPGAEFARMYFRYNLGENADSALRKGYLGQ